MNPILIRGVPGSPYTRKMVALLRYRQLPYRWILAGHGNTLKLPAPKVELLPTLYFADGHGELEAVVDSTPIIRRLESFTMQRSVIPTDPAIAFLDELIEDFGDEWMTKFMFHYRWRYAADIDKAGEILPRWSSISAPETGMQERKSMIQQRQISRLFVVGSNETTQPTIESSYLRTLKALQSIVEAQPFMMGHRPGASDFAVYGQLTQLALFDPTPMAIAVREAPRVYAWTEVMDDLSGLEVSDNAWIDRDQVKLLLPLLQEFGRTYVPVLLANAKAVANGLDRVEATVEGSPWIQQPFPYQARCLQWLRASYHRLDSDDRCWVDAALSATDIPLLWSQP